MKITPSEKVQGAFVVEIDRYKDARGFFQEIYSDAKYGEMVRKWSQANVSMSQAHAIRGLHRSPYDKMGTCVKGRLFDVVVDLRPGSPTFKQWDGVWLDEENCKQLFVPAGCGHGLYSAVDGSLFVYVQSGLFDPKNEVEVNWRDPELAIAWPEAAAYVVSDKDAKSPFVRDLTDRLR